jgi:hypothetical protein
MEPEALGVGSMTGLTDRTCRTDQAAGLEAPAKDRETWHAQYL